MDLTSKELEILNELDVKRKVTRLFLSREEIKVCNRLVKKGYLYKSKTDEKNSTISFYITDKLF